LEPQSDKISNIDIQDDNIDNPYPISISNIPYRDPIDFRYPISISHIDIGSYLVTLTLLRGEYAYASSDDRITVDGTFNYTYPCYLNTVVGRCRLNISNPR